MNNDELYNKIIMILRAVAKGECCSSYATEDCMCNPVSYRDSKYKDIAKVILEELGDYEKKPIIRQTIL